MLEKPINIILNKGSTAEERSKLAEEITKEFANLGKSVQIITIEKNNFAEICKRTVEQAQKQSEIIIAAGGDGTVNYIVGLCYKHKVTMGIIPLGTFNYFARELGISTNMAEAVQTIVYGNLKNAAIGHVNGKIFINNASFGLYTQLIREREQASSRFGRWRIVAAVSAALSLFKRHKLFSIILNKDGEIKEYRTAMVFIGNNTLQLENLGMKAASFTRKDRLAVIIMKKSSSFEIARFLLRGAVKNLKDETKLVEFSADELKVFSERKHIDLVIDGEITRSETPLEFRIERNALNVLSPEKIAK